MSGKWFVVPTKEEIAQRKKDERKAKQAAAAGIEYDAVKVQAAERRERERERARQEADRQDRDDRVREAHAIKERAKAEAKAAAVRKSEATERHRRSLDPKCWPTCVAALFKNSVELADELDELFEMDLLAGAGPCLRLEYVMATIDKATHMTTMPEPKCAADRNLEPADTFLQLAPNNNSLLGALNDHFKEEWPTAAEVLQLCAVSFGSKGNKVSKPSEGLGARLVLQLALRKYADIVANELDIFTTFFFAGAAGDKSSAAFVNLVFVLDQIMPEVTDAALRNAVVSVANNADKLQLPGDILAPVLGGWFKSVADRLDALDKGKAASVAGAGDSKPLLLSAGGADVLLQASGASGIALVMLCGVHWHSNAGLSLVGPMLKKARGPTDAATVLITRIIRETPALASQLVSSFASATAQVNVVLAALASAHVPLPKAIAEDLQNKLRESAAKGGKPASAEALAATSKLLGNVKTSRDSAPPARRVASAEAKPKSSGSLCGTIVTLVLVAVAGSVAACIAFPESIAHPQGRGLARQANAFFRQRVDALRATGSS